MKRFAVRVVALCCSLPFVAGAFADSPRWSPEKAAKVAENRCGNAGIGNGAEGLATGSGPSSCEKRILDRFENDAFDVDPGNSGDHNANNRW